MLSSPGCGGAHVSTMRGETPRPCRPGDGKVVSLVQIEPYIMDLVRCCSVSLFLSSSTRIFFVDVLLNLFN